MTEDLFKHLEGEREQRIQRLFEFLRIESVSTDDSYSAGIRRAAEWTAGQLEECGLRASIEPTGGHPVVLAKLEVATGDSPGRDAPADAPHVLFYGHYDVQPADPVEKWTTPPFEPTIRNNAIYARGSSDDKGQVMCFIEALRAWRKVRGKIPVKLTVLIEGDEECGSVGLEPYVKKNVERLKADVAVVSDTSMWENDTPAICYGLRGLLYFDVQLHGPGRDLHSGVYGGTVANPANELLKVLGQLFDGNHHVMIAGFYDDVISPSAEERAEWKTLKFDESKWAKSVGMDATFGEKGFSTLERKWCRPSCDINGVYGGYSGPGAKTIIPSFAGAKVSFRLAPDQKPHVIAENFRGWLEERTPMGCRWKITEFSRADPVVVDRKSPYMTAARRAMAAGFGTKPVLVREGATIPVVATFKQVLGIDTLLMGFGRNDDAIHSPNEKFELANFDAGCRTHAALLHELSR